MRSLICLGAALLLAMGASAQTRYSCRTPGGSMFFSDRPCTGQLVIGTPAPAPSVSRSYPSTGEAPSYLQYMSPRCASLNDALRTGYARGLKFDTINKMRHDYQAECGDNEREAMMQSSRDAVVHLQERYVERRAQVNAQNEAHLHDQQCEESKSILISKRNRPDLTDGEREELKRFEANYHARCSQP